ncbi:efflux RND transporter periplasmic adaptor subunit [Chitinophaga niabensis]|uniref:RND family efflux transporter, MFP subunit n=1 Tax=Chitinophaga niabensis TaxID=536979 RepID=A0A1N6K1J9_9BACT|nr:efflux RND transporter periplasmic adaptor subunit [Chitinophaga niabensis]SIO50206.1 RND family efflux transporter, MFP subunit [Chitinophaga niabensis]
MTKRYFVLPLITVILAACGGGGGNKAEELQKLKQEKSALDAKISALEKELKTGDSSVKMKTVTVAALENTTFEHYIDIQGSVDAKENVDATAQVPGTIRAIYVKEGQAVSKGQALAQVDDQVLRSSLAELQTRLDLAKVLYEKQENLWKQQIGSEVQFLTAKNQKEALERNLATMKDQLAQARIVAPISGTVDAVIAKVGDNAAPGVPAFRIVNGNNLRVVANVAESFAGKVKTGAEVLLTFPDINKEQRTRIGFASKTIDPVSRSIRVEVPLKSTADLNPNMIAQLRIIDYKAPSAVVVPVSVIQYSLGKPYVLTVKGSGDKLQAVRNNIEIGRTYNDKAEIKSGLQAGDRIITSGFQGVNDNDFVKL